MGIAGDLRHAVRTIIREPGFAAFCILMLALGIGANTAIFSVVNGVLLRPLPYREPERLVSIGEIIPAIAATYPTLPVSARHFTEFTKRCRSFESLSAISTGTGNLTGVGEPERVQMARVSANFFETLGVPPRLGRGFLPGEDSEGHDRVAVLSDAFWKRRFQSDSSIIGKTITLNDLSCTVVGVLPPHFQFPATSLFESGPTLAEKPEVLRPMAFPQSELNQKMGAFNYPVVARLKPGVGRKTALAELNVITAQLEKEFGEKLDLKGWVGSLQENMVGRSRRSLIVLLCVVGAVLLIACVNLANLMLARSERKRREWALRTALGAGRAGLIRQVLAETVLLSLAGGAVGVALAAASIRELVHLAPATIPRLDEAGLDLRVLIFALGLTFATGLFFGLVPAWRASRSDPQEELKSGGRAATGERQGARFRNALVSAEVGLSTVLLILAVLLGNSFLRVMRNDKGFRAPTVLAADVAISPTTYAEREQRNRFHERVLENLRDRPGVVSAAITTALPLTGETWVDSVWIPGDTTPETSRPIVNVRFVSPDYLKTMGIPLISGRTFDNGDRDRKVVVLSERIAERLWPGENPLGRRVTHGDEQPYEVIGVAGDVRTDPDKSPVAIVYRPYWDYPPRSVMLAVRAAGDPRTVAASMREAIREVDPGVPVPEMRTMRDILDETVAQRRFYMLLSGSFAATALLLAALGIYSVVSYTVARRTNEMGIRIALGAHPWHVHRMVLRQALTPVAAGLALGTAAALGAGRLVGSMLYEVKAHDPATLAITVVLLAGIALAASWPPTRRATQVDPLQVLRYE